MFLYALYVLPVLEQGNLALTDASLNLVVREISNADDIHGSTLCKLRFKNIKEGIVRRLRIWLLPNKVPVNRIDGIFKFA